MLEYSGLMTGENIDADMTFRDPQTTDVFALHVQYSQENKTFSSHMTREQS